jgi:hypothetical protein
VHGTGFSFNAPGGWKVTAGKGTASASQDSQLVQVTAYPLLHAYDDALFGKVRTELDARIRGVAQQLQGTVSGSRTVTVDGIRAHSYDLTAGNDLLQYTFVLRGMKEFELLCRRPSSKDDAPCKELLTSFSA